MRFYEPLSRTVVRTDDGGHMELQALRYAAMVSTMTFTQAVEAYRGVLTREGKDADPEQEHPH